MNKLSRLITRAGIDGIDMEKRIVAIKTHFGEYGNLSFLRPNYAKVIADAVKSKGGIPFLTDTNTLYVGHRKNAIEHIETASMNGFGPLTTGCPVIIADGLKGTDDVEVEIDGEYVKKAKIARGIVDADVLVTLSHFKCHELAGFGGALKNLAMGCASRAGKMDMHSAGKPELDSSSCRGCGKCVKNCGQDAITLTNKVAAINYDKCVGCGRCIGACPFDVIYSAYDQNIDILNAKMLEYAMAATKDKPCFHVVIITDVSPFCDCHAENDTPIIPNVGMLASFDPVALDRACVDLVMKQPMIEGSLLHINCGGRCPENMFKAVQPNSKWQSIFEHAEKIGYGSTNYELVKVK